MRVRFASGRCAGKRSPGTENLLEIKTTLSAVGRVLHAGHAARILIEHVGKPTDNRPARLFCCRLADPDSPEAIGRRQPRRISQSPSTRLGPAATSTEVTGPGLRTGPDVEVWTESPKGHREGDRSRVRMSSPRRTTRDGHNARLMRHSVGGKVAINGNY